METKTEIETPAMDAMRYITEQYAGGGITRLNRAIIWDDTGLARMGCIAGWLTGLALSQPEVAEEMAKELLSSLAYIVGANDKETHSYGDFPRRRCVLSDDGTRHGFALQWYTIIPVAEVQLWEQRGKKVQWWSPFQTDKVSTQGYHTKPYLYSHNGGLLWHGPGDNSFAVSLSTCYWGVHT